MKYLAIDYGLKRTGIAVSDPQGVMAFPRTTLAMKGKDAFFTELLGLAEEEHGEAFVVGLPLRQGGEQSETTRQVLNMVKRLSRRTDLSVYLMPEALSSYQAESLLRDVGMGSTCIKHALDQAAAVAILESFLALSQEQMERLLHK